MHYDIIIEVSKFFNVWLHFFITYKKFFMAKYVAHIEIKLLVPWFAFDVISIKFFHSSMSRMTRHERQLQLTFCLFVFTFTPILIYLRVKMAKTEFMVNQVQMARR